MIHVHTRTWDESLGWSQPSQKLPKAPQLVFIFGDTAIIETKNVYAQVRTLYPQSHILIATNAGTILGKDLLDSTLSLAALYFEKTRIWYAETTIDDIHKSRDVGARLAEFLPTTDLRHAFVVSDGVGVNGSQLVEGINATIPNTIAVTGALAADGFRSERTYVGLNAKPKRNTVGLIGFYGKHIHIAYSSQTGWHATSKKYTITRSDGNVLYELDNRPAVEVFTEIMGEELAAHLPTSGGAFPLELQLKDGSKVIRTVIGYDKEHQSLTFAGDIPSGTDAYIMNTTNELLAEHAGRAANKAMEKLGMQPQFALPVSCYGRKAFMKENTHLEVEALAKELGTTPTFGFYTNGELAPTEDSGVNCKWHNQTMTITLFAED